MDLMDDDAAAVMSASSTSDATTTTTTTLPRYSSQVDALLGVVRDMELELHAALSREAALRQQCLDLRRRHAVPWACLERSLARTENVLMSLHDTGAACVWQQRLDGGDGSDHPVQAYDGSITSNPGEKSSHSVLQDEGGPHRVTDSSGDDDDDEADDFLIRNDADADTDGTEYDGVGTAVRGASQECNDGVSVMSDVRSNRSAGTSSTHAAATAILQEVEREVSHWRARVSAAEGEAQRLRTASSQLLTASLEAVGSAIASTIDECCIRSRGSRSGPPRVVADARAVLHDALLAEISCRDALRAAPSDALLIVELMDKYVGSSMGRIEALHLRQHSAFPNEVIGRTEIEEIERDQPLPVQKTPDRKPSQRNWHALLQTSDEAPLAEVSNGSSSAARSWRRLAQKGAFPVLQQSRDAGAMLPPSMTPTPRTLTRTADALIPFHTGAAASGLLMDRVLHERHRHGSAIAQKAALRVIASWMTFQQRLSAFRRWNAWTVHRHELRALGRKYRRAHSRCARDLLFQTHVVRGLWHRYFHTWRLEAESRCAKRRVTRELGRIAKQSMAIGSRLKTHGDLWNDLVDDVATILEGQLLMIMEQPTSTVDEVTDIHQHRIQA